jgi:hypothetical protein
LQPGVVILRPEASEPDAAELQHDDGSAQEVALDGGEVGEQERDLLLRATVGASAEEDERRHPLLAKREECPEVGVGRDDDGAFGAGALDDLLVARRL